MASTHGKTTKFEERLLAERGTLAADIPRVGQLAELFTRPEVLDPEDRSVQETARDVALDIIDRRSSRLVRINAALKRVAEGIYGMCVECDEPIATARLEADPAVALCIECQRKLEESAPLRSLSL